MADGMTDASPRFRDRTGWGSGPWDNEPDAVSWVSAVGLPCEMRRGGRGNWCGYVGVSSDHPIWGLGDWSLEVHGGVTWDGNSERLAKYYPDEGPFPLGLKWLGFDCRQANDRCPNADDYERRVYRDLAYVSAECERLAAQIDAAAILSEAGFGGPRHLRGDHWSAPAWAVEYTQRFHLPRAERLTMLRRLAADPVAAQLAEAMGIAG